MEFSIETGRRQNTPKSLNKTKTLLAEKVPSFGGYLSELYSISLSQKMTFSNKIRNSPTWIWLNLRICLMLTKHIGWDDLNCFCKTHNFPKCTNYIHVYSLNIQLYLKTICNQLSGYLLLWASGCLIKTSSKYHKL